MKSTTTCIIGVFLLTVSFSSADIFPGMNKYHDICNEIIDSVIYNNVIIRRSDLAPCPTGCPVSRTITRSEMCQILVARHNTRAASFIGGITISELECQSALLAPQVYLPADWNRWAGRHCGTWKQLDDNGVITQTFIDNALWHPAITTYNSNFNQYFYKQNVVFDRPGTCCDDGWNESGGSYTVSWGWDPKDPINHGGYQGSCVAYSFTTVSLSATGNPAFCIIWITGEEAFLECVANGSWGSRRTSVGYWGFGLWGLESPNIPCPVTAEPIKDKLTHGLLGQPE